MPNTIPSFRNVSVSDIVAITLLVPSPEATEKMTMREVENAFGPALDRCVDLFVKLALILKRSSLRKRLSTYWFRLSKEQQIMSRQLQ